MTTDLRFRQIYLDSHISEAIDGIGADFDPDVFADTLGDGGSSSGWMVR